MLQVQAAEGEAIQAIGLPAIAPGHDLLASFQELRGLPFDDHPATTAVAATYHQQRHSAKG